MLETVLAHIDSAPRDKQRGGSKSKLVVVLYTALPMNITALVTDPRVSAIVQVQKRPFFSHFYINDQLCQDRLRTNIRKVEKTRLGDRSGLLPAALGRAGCSGCADRQGQPSWAAGKHVA